MSLPSDYFTASISDVQHRFKNTIIEYNDKPYYVLGVLAGRSRVGLNLLSPVTLKSSEVNIDDPDLNIKGLGRKTGLMNMEIVNNKVGFIVRLPTRSMMQGIGWNNSIFGIYREHKAHAINAPSRPCLYPTCNVWEECELSESVHLPLSDKMNGLGIIDALGPYLISSGLTDMWQNKYPALDKVLASDSIISRAVTRLHAVVKDDFDEAYLVTRGDIVGKFISRNKVKYKPKKAYLAEEAKRMLDVDAV